MRFSSSGFSHVLVSLGPLSIQLWPFQIFMKIHGDIRNFVDTGDKLFTGVNDTRDYVLSWILIGSKTPAINLLLVQRHR
jgi:hypothetical protein